MVNNVFRRKSKINISESVKANSIEEIDKMTGVQFEIFLIKIYKSLGYNVTKTEKLDDGLDLIIEKGRESIGIQVKRYDGKVEKFVVDATHAAKSRRNYERFNLKSVMIITCGELTLPAYSAAKELGVIVKDRQDVILDFVKMSDVVDSENNSNIMTETSLRKEDIDFLNLQKFNNYKELVALREKIRELRKEFAIESGIASNKLYLVFNDDTVDDLLKKRPQSLAELEKVLGFGTLKTQKYGKAVVKIFISDKELN